MGHNSARLAWLVGARPGTDIPRATHERPGAQRNQLAMADLRFPLSHTASMLARWSATGWARDCVACQRYTYPEKHHIT